MQSHGANLCVLGTDDLDKGMAHGFKELDRYLGKRFAETEPH